MFSFALAFTKWFLKWTLSNTTSSKTSAPSVTFVGAFVSLFRWKHSSSLVSICQSTTSWRTPPWCCPYRDFWAICEQRGMSDKDTTPSKRVYVSVSLCWIISVTVRPFPGDRLTALVGNASSDHLWMNINDSTLHTTNASVTARRILMITRTRATHTVGGMTNERTENKKCELGEMPYTHLFIEVNEHTYYPALNSSCCTSHNLFPITPLI